MINIRRFWSYIVIAILLAIIAYMYFNRNVCPVTVPAIKNEEGYEHVAGNGNSNGNGNGNVQKGPVDKVRGELVLYYATWCGYSKQFLPIWKEFVETHAKEIDGLVTRSVICEGGEERACFEKGVEGYPTVILYPKNNTEVVFNGDRTVSELEQFVHKHLD